MNRPIPSSGGTASQAARVAGLAVGLGLGLMLTSCSPGNPSAAPAPAGRGAGPGAPVTISAALVADKPMTVRLRTVGNVEPASTVEIRSQVTGELMSVGFAEGHDVSAGQVLFTIDPRPFEATVRQVEAALARDTALAKNAEAQRARYADLAKQGLVSQAEYDAVVASAASLQATIAADAAQLENARLQLQYTKITARVSGRTGALLAHRGSLVRANDAAPLVVINEIAPVFVSFAVAARVLPELRAEQARGALAVQATAPDNPEAASDGTVTFIDNTVDPASDTIRLKAKFDNRDRRLWPGTFVDVALRLSVRPHAIVVRAVAVQPGQQGPFVYVVKEDQTVEARQVVIAWTDGPETVIDRGVQPGEMVVTDGHLRLAPGMRVVVKPAVEQQKAGS